MPELDDELRRILAAKAGGVHADGAPPPDLLRRSRQRRVLTGLVASGTVAGVVVAASFGVAAVVREKPGAVIGPAGSPTPAPSPNGWAGIWPQSTLNHAEEAQRRADEGEHQFDFQLDPKYLLQRFAMEALEWQSWEDIWFASPLPNESSSGPVTILMGDCEAVGTEECPREAEVTIERLLRREPTGIWLVTHVDTKDVVPSIPHSPLPVEPTPSPSPEEWGVTLIDFVESFLEARLAGEGAEAFLAPGTRRAFERGDNGVELYDPAGRWTHAEVVGAEGVNPYITDVYVRIQYRDDGCWVFTEGVLVRKDEPSNPTKLWISGVQRGVEPPERCA